MNHGQYRMSGRQPRREGLFLQPIWSQTLILSLLFITFGFMGEAYGAAGDTLGYYIHPQAGQQIAYAAAFGSDGSKVIVGSTKPTEGATEDYYVMKLSTGSNSLAWAAPVTFNLASGTDQAVAVVIDSQANVVVTGSAFNGVNYDIHTIKYNGADGTVIWQNTFNGTYNGDDSAAAIALDDDNNIYIGGYTQGANGYEDFLVLKYNSTGPIGGKPTWKATYNNATNNNADKVNAIAVSHGDNPYVAVTGISRNASNFDVLTVKYDASGTQQWAVFKNGGSGDDWGLKVKMDSFGDVVIAGYVNNGLNADIYLAKYTGNTASPPIDWQVTYSGGSGGDEPRDLAIDATNNVYVTGFSYSSSAGFNNYFTAKYYGTGASKGTLAWPSVKTYNSSGDNPDTAMAIAVSDDSVYVTGSAGTSANQNIVAIKYRKDNGTEIWVSPFTTGTAGYNDSPVGISIASDGKIHVAGTTAIDATFNTDFVGLRIEPGALNTPTDLSATLISQSEIRLDWTLNSTTETGVEIFRRTATTEYSETPTYTLNGTGIISYNNTGLTAHTKYYYKIRVFGTNGAFSLFSNEVSKQTTVYNYAAPTWTYKFAHSNGSHDVANAVAVGPDNHPVAAGYSIISYDSSQEYYTVKLNYSTKAVIWSAIYGVMGEAVSDEALSVTVDSNNYPIVSGYSTLNNSGSDTKDFYTIKYDKVSGLTESPGWERPDNGFDNGDDEVVAVVSTKDGSNNIVVVGWGMNLSGNTDIFVVKYNGTNGTPLWSGPAIKVYNGGANDRPAAVALDSNGDIIVTGRMHSGSNYDIFTRKYSGTNGATIWTVIKSGGFGDDEGLDVAVGSDNSVYVTGYLTNASGKKDIHTVKYKSAYDAVDQKIWDRTYNGAAGGNDWATAVRVDTNGDDNNILIAGNTEQSTIGKHDYIVIKYDSAGTVLWTRTLDRPSNNDMAKTMAMDRTGNICIAGNTDSNFSDIMTVKYGYDGEVIGTTLYNGAAGKEDAVKGMAVSQLGHAYVAGYSENAAGNFDFLLLQCEGNLLQSPAPFTPTPYYLSIDFTWANNNLDGDGYKMRRQVGSCATANPNNWTTFTFSNATVDYSDTGLNMGTTYCYQIQAYKTAGTESRWLEKTVTTIHPPMPGSFTATATNTTTVHLSWVDNLNGEDRFELKRCTGSGTACDEDAEFTLSLPNQVAGTIEYDDVSACADTTYTYMIQGIKGVTILEWDSYIGYATVTTPAVVNPAMQTAVKQSEGRIDLNWTDTNTDLTGYKVYRCDATAVPGCTPSVLVGTRTVIAKPSGNVLYLQMDESAWTGAAGQIIDSSGANNNATAYGGVSTTTGGRDYSRAGSFDGTNDYISWAYSGGRPTNNFTMAAWVKVTATHEIDAQATSGTAGTAGQKFLFWPEQMADPNSGAGISVGTNGISVYELAGSYMPPLAVYSGSLGIGWNHIVVTYTNKQPRIYLNGSLVTTGLTSPRTSVYAPVIAGGGVYGYLAGTVDEVAVFNRTLTDAEVTSYYNYLANFKRITDLPLTPNTSYRYGVTVFKTAASSCNGGWETTASASGVLTATTDNVTDATHVPVMLTATKDATEATSKINLTWQDKTETEESFYIERCAGGACDFSIIDKTDTVAANVTSYSDLSACQGAYRYRVSAKRTTGSNWQSSPSNVLGDTTNTMAAPSGLTWDSANSNEEQIKLTWTDTNMDEDGIEIWRCTGSGCSDFGASAIATVGRGVTTYTNTRLNPDTVYVYKVRAVKSAGCTWQTAFTSTVTANTNVSNKGALNLSATALNTTQIDLGWSDITSNESGFVLERCAGTCDSGGNFSTKYGIGVGSTAYSDVTNVCQGQTYSYRLKAIDQEFTYGYNGCWTKRVQLTTITGFQADSVIEFTVNYATDMQTDFDDLRFYQFTDGTLTDGQVLPHWIYKKTDSTSAVVWLKTGANANFIYMYYGNSNAAKVPNGGGVFEFYDDFQGTTVDSNKWENYGTHMSLFQDNGLRLIENDATYRSFTSRDKFARDEDRTLFYRTTMTTASLNNYWFAGFSKDIISTAYADLVHGLYYYRSYVYAVYENNAATVYPYKYYSDNYIYDIKMVASKNGGAKYYIRGGGSTYNYGMTWSAITDTTARNPLAVNTPLRVMVLQTSGNAVMDTIGVFKKDLVPVSNPVLGAVQGDGVACLAAMPHEWASAYSDIVTATAKTATPATGLTGTALSESQLSLSWTTATPDVTGVKLLRCTGDSTACASGPFSEIAAIGVAPVVRFEMDEASWNGTANEIKDGVGGKNHGTSFGGATMTASGHSGKAGVFDGSNDYAGWSYSGGIPTNNFTISAWVKATTTHEVDTEATSGTAGTSGQKYLFGTNLMNAISSGVGISVGTNGISVYEHSGGYLPPLAVYSGSLGTGWNHIVVTYTNKMPRIYLNGTMVRTGNTSPKTYVYAPTRLGGDAAYGYFGGTVDEVTIYDQSLSLAEVQNLYLLGSKTYADSGLNQDTWYTYKLALYKANASCAWNEGSIGYSTPFSLKTNAPPAPTITGAAAANTTDVTITWTDNTGSNTAFQVQRCDWNGSTCSAYATIGTTEGNATSFTDKTACKGSQYKYRMLADNKVFPVTLTNAGGSGWARKKPLVITSFQANYQTKVVIPYDPDMRADFADLRFRDETAGAELPYWIESQTNGVTATVWFKTGANNDVSLYFGNYNAASSSNGVNTFTLFDDFNDNLLDAKWAITVDTNGLPTGETGGAIRFGTGSASATNLWSRLRTAIAAANVLFLDMNESTWNSTAGEVKDASSVGNNARSYSMTSNPVAGGHTGKAGLFDGVNDYLLWAYTSQPADNFTMAAWVKTSNQHYIDTQANSGSTGNGSGATAKKYVFYPVAMTGSNAQAGISVGTNGISVYEQGASYFPAIAVCSTGSCASLGTGWNHIVVTYTNKQPRIYLNGELVTTGLTSTKTVYAPTRMGGTTNNWFGGTVDEAAVYNRALTDAEVKSLYTQNYVEEYKLQIATYQGGAPYLQDISANNTSANRANYRLYQNGTGWQWGYLDANSIWQALSYSPSIATGSGFVKVKLVHDGSSLKVYENDSYVTMNSVSDLMAGSNKYGIGLNAADAISGFAFDVDDYRIRQYAATEPTVTIGAETVGTTVNWTSDPSAESNAVTTANSSKPVLNSATRISEAQIDLGWTDATSDETGFKIERCEGVATNCTTFIVGANTTTYTDKGLKNDQQYCYRISAVKSVPGGCNDGWDSDYSVDQRCDSTTSTAPTVAAGTGVTTQAANSTQVDLVWTDNTKSEEGFIFWRCLDNGSNNCANDGNYADISATAGTAGANRMAWSDTTACEAKTYFYKVQAFSNGPNGAGAPALTNAGGGTWLRRARINVSAGFQTDYQTRIVITYDSDMQADFDDLRFYDEVAEQELPYWIEKKTDGTNATVWFKTKTSSASLSLYYGNASATSSSSGTGVFGAANFMSKTTGGTLSGPFVNANGYTIEAGVVLYALNSGNTTIRFDATGTYQGTSILYSETGTYFSRIDYNAAGGVIRSENSSVVAHTLNSPQRWTIKVLNSSYWLLLNDVQQKTAANLQYASDSVIFNSGTGLVGGYYDYILVRKYAATEPTVAIQAEEITPVQTWLSPKSAADDATTATVSTPVLDQTNTKRLTENQIQVAWTDTNPDESYFIVERGNPACDAGSFVVIGNTGAPNVYTYTDTGTDLDATYGLPVGQTYCYRVRPFKTAYCLWPNKYSGTKAVTTDVPAPTSLTALNTDTTTIHLEWDDVTKTETGFDIYRCSDSGTSCDEDSEFSLLASRGPHTTVGVKVTYDDTAVCPAHTYTYRVKAVRTSNWSSPFSAGASATTIATVAPSALSEAEIYDSAVDQRKIKLYWTDTNADETGFKIERCNYTVSGDCNGVNYTEVGIHPINLNETFTSQIDPAVWNLIGALQGSSGTFTSSLSISNVSGLSSIAWSNGKAVLRTTSVNLVEANYNYSKLQLADPELLGNGNYDISLDYNIPTALPAYAQYYNFAKLRISYPMAPGKSVTDYIYVERSQGNYVIKSTINGVTSATTTTPTTHTSGKFRIKKVGTTITVYYNWENNAWNSSVSYVDSSNVLAGVMPTDVFVIQHTQRNEAQDITTEIDNVKIDATRLKFTDFSGSYPLNPSSTYYYRVRAYKTHSAACSEWNNLPTTNEVWEPTNPATPTTLIARAAGSKKMELLWTDNATDENGYIVEKKAANGKYVEIATLFANKKKYVDTINLDPNTSYTYRVRAFRNSDGSYSPYSNEATGKTFVWAKPNSDDTTCKPVE